MGHDRTRIVDSNHFHEARERAERDDMRPVRPSSLVYIVVGRRPGLAAPRGSSASANMVARRRTGVVITDFHAKYFAYEFGRRCSSDSVEKLTAVLADAQVDLNPHQIEAALFAFRSPFSKGAILADEVGLGKTIEAGLLLAQKWAERRLDLMGVEIDLRIGENGGELLDAVGRAAPTELIGEVLGVEVGDHARGASPIDLP